MAARFRLKGKIYSMASLDEISLRDLVLFNSQAEEIGLKRKWSDVERISKELDSLPPEEANVHPERLLAISVTVWACRRLAGDTVTFGEAIDIPVKDIEFLPDTGDHKPGKRAGAKKAPSKKTRKGSARPSARKATSSAPETPTTSESPSLTE